MGVPLAAVGAAAALCFFAPDAHAGRRGGGGSRGGGRSMGAASSGYKSRGNVGNIYGSKVSQLIVRSIRMSGWRVSSQAPMNFSSARQYSGCQRFRWRDYGQAVCMSLLCIDIRRRQPTLTCADNITTAPD